MCTPPSINNKYTEYIYYICPNMWPVKLPGDSQPCFFSSEHVLLPVIFQVYTLHKITVYEKIHDSDFNLNDILSIILPGSGTAIESTD